MVLGDLGDLDARLDRPVAARARFAEGEVIEESAARPSEAEIRAVLPQFVGEIEQIPLPDDSVDVIISNCVINLSADKDKVIREARSSDAAEKLQGEAANVKSRVEESDYGAAARDTVVQGLNWLSEEFGKLAEQFAPAICSPRVSARGPPIPSSAARSPPAAASTC